jgi:hypothetical protein
MKIQQLELFKIFTGKDSLRPVVELPFEFEGKVYATDAHKLIRCDKSLVEFELENPHKSLNATKSFTESDCNRIIKTKLEDFEIFKIEDDYDCVGKDIDCSECDGSGDVLWTYKYGEKEYDCPVCDGSGLMSKTRLVPNGKKTFNKQAYATIDGVFYNINVLISIFEAQKIIGEDLVSLNICKKTKPALFKIGDYEFLIMPILDDEYSKSLIEITFI